MNNLPAKCTLGEAMSFTSGFCENCKYWDNQYNEPARAGTTDPPKGMGHCENPIFHEGYQEVDNEEIYRSGAIIEDDEGWAWFVAPNFGCIHFTKKDECRRQRRCSN